MVYNIKKYKIKQIFIYKYLRTKQTHSMIESLYIENTHCVYY